MGLMLSFMLYPNTDLSCSVKIQKSSLDWWFRLLIGRCCWMRSTTLSYLLILALKRCILCFLLVSGGQRCAFPVREFFSSVRFVNMLKIAYNHPQAY